MSCAICSTRRSIASAALIRMAPRAGAGVRAQPFSAAWAAAIAASTSAMSLDGKLPISSEVCIGLQSSAVAPEAAGSHSPLM